MEIARDPGMACVRRDQPTGLCGRAVCVLRPGHAGRTQGGPSIGPARLPRAARPALQDDAPGIRDAGATGHRTARQRF